MIAIDTVSAASASFDAAPKPMPARSSGSMVSR